MTRFRALPYAKALMAVVKDETPERREAVAEELDRVTATLDSVPEFFQVLVSPTVSVEVKSTILDEVLDALEIGQPTRRFLRVVQQHYRMQHMADIALAYRELLDQSLGRTRVSVETAAALDADQRDQLVHVVEAMEDTSVVADFAVNPDLLGGFRLQVGSRVFDGSLAGELGRLSREIEIEQG